MSTSFEQIPGVARPARDALTAAGYRDLESLDGVDWEAASGLHGVGKRGLERLQAALLERGLSMRNAPAPEERSAEWTRGNTGTGAPDLVTARTEESPAGYVEKLEGRRREHGRLLLEIFGRATGERPAMWGPSMIGYGQAHYRYATGGRGTPSTSDSARGRRGSPSTGCRGCRGRRNSSPAWENTGRRCRACTSTSRRTSISAFSRNSSGTPGSPGREHVETTRQQLPTTKISALSR